MRFAVILVAVTWLSLAFGSAALASLIDRGHGLIYDDVLDITWLQDANYAKTTGYDADGRMLWADALAWADGLVYLGFDDWRLPTLGPIDGSTFLTGTGQFTNNATSDEGFAKTTTNGLDGGWRNAAGEPTSEMGYMFYVNLANRGYCTPNDAAPSTCVAQAGWGLNNSSFVDEITGKTVALLNLESDSYWSGLAYVLNTEGAWTFNFRSGSAQFGGDRTPSNYAWAVRDGDVFAAPAPGTAALLILGLVGITSRRILRRCRTSLPSAGGGKLTSAQRGALSRC